MISTLVKTLEIGPIEMGQKPRLLFRLEVLKAEGRYYSRLYRLDTFRLKPSFEGNTSDEETWVADPNSQIGDCHAKTQAGLVRQVVDRLEKQLGRRVR